MRIPYFAFPYRVRSDVPGWRGWRLFVALLLIADSCECPNLEHSDSGCPCADREPHRHTFFGSTDLPLWFPKAQA